jgi:Fe-S cluster assembly protein SufD
MSVSAPTTAFDVATLDRMLADVAVPEWERERRRRAFDVLSGIALPDRRDENWMRTDIRAFRPSAWPIGGASGQEQSLPAGLLEAAIQSARSGGEAFDDSVSEPRCSRLAGRIVSLNGVVHSEELDASLRDQGVVFGSPEQVLAEHGDAVREHWFGVIESECDWFAAAHAAFSQAGCVLLVPNGVKIRDPLHLLSAISPGGVDFGHVLVVLGDDAEATVLTETAGGGASGTAGGFHCGGTEIVVGKRAFLRMVNLQNWNTGVWHVARQKARVDESGSLQWTLGALGSRLSQVAQDVALVGRRAHAQVNGVMFTEGRQQLVYNTLQHHEAPECTSDLLYKGGLQDRSRLVWRGMIKVDQVAQKTDGYQRNDVLMLSEQARADSIPGLEIEADDVRCTHGATSGRVDAEQIFYAQARGLTADEAARLVVAGFFQQVFDRITIPSVREALAAAIGLRIRRIA